MGVEARALVWHSSSSRLKMNGRKVGIVEETHLTRTMNRAAREIRASRDEAANWWHLADGSEELARELAYQLSRIGVDLEAVQIAAARPVSNRPELAALVKPDLEYALTVAIDQAREKRRKLENPDG